MSVPCSGSGSVKAGGCDEGPGICSVILTLVSVILVIATLPFSLLLVVKVVQVQAEERYPLNASLTTCQEYERAVIFRLGLLLTGGTRGPGVFFILPCVDVYEKIDMRTQTFNVPPQEVCMCKVQRSSRVIQNRFRFSPRTVSLCLSMQLCIIRSDLGFLRKTLKHHDIQIYNTSKV